MRRGHSLLTFHRYHAVSASTLVHPSMSSASCSNWLWVSWQAEAAIGGVTSCWLLEVATGLRNFAAVCGHGEDVRDDEDAEAPGEGEPDVGADRLLREQVADRVDD